MMDPGRATSKNDVIILGVGKTPVGEHWEKSLRELAFEAIQAARAEAGMLAPQALFVANMLSPMLSGQTQLGALIADFAGLDGIEAVTIEAGGASGGMAIRQAYRALGSGSIDVALVVGVEKVTDQVGSQLDSALATAMDADFEAVQGITPSALAGMLMRRYLHQYQAPEDALSGFSITAHANAETNPQAMFRRAISHSTYAKAPMQSEPLNMFDAAPVADGAAALLLARSEAIATVSPRPMVRIVASGAATAPPSVHDRRDPLRFGAAAQSCTQAYAQAGIGPEEVQVFELHDLFTVYAALILEAAGFAEPGQGWQLARDGAISRDGSIPISTFGGSKARGDSAGATGVYQVAEVTLQLQGLAGENQVPDATVGMAQCLGGAAATAVTHVLSRVEGS